MEGLFIVFIGVVLVIAATGIKIVRPWEKGLVERLGKYQRTADSGLTFILPFMEKITKVFLPYEAFGNMVFNPDIIYYNSANNTSKRG